MDKEQTSPGGCQHEYIRKGYHLGLSADVYVCTQCGESRATSQWDRFEERRRPLGLRSSNEMPGQLCPDSQSDALKNYIGTTSDEVMKFTREDIAEMRRAPTHADCKTLHSAIRAYCRALLDCGLISEAQHKELMAEACAELLRWEANGSRV